MAILLERHHPQDIEARESAAILQEVTAIIATVAILPEHLHHQGSDPEAIESAAFLVEVTAITAQVAIFLELHHRGSDPEAY